MAGTLSDNATQTEEPEAVLDARRWGMNAVDIAAIAVELGGARQVEAGSVWPGHVAAVMLFLAAASQWRTGVRQIGNRLETLWIGLDYAGAQIAAEALDLVVTPSAWAGFLVIENAARDALNGDGQQP